MDAHHRAGVEAFVANQTAPLTAGVGAVDFEGRLEGGVRVFELTAAPLRWEVAPGQQVDAWGYNGMVPGPTLRAREGERIRVIVRNGLPESTAVHWHGQHVPNSMDGVPFLTQQPIAPGANFTYEFVPRPAGTHLYHSHHNSAEQVGRGLAGVLAVAADDPQAEPAVDQDHVFVFHDKVGGFTINGKGFPATSAYRARVGERLRFRFTNLGSLTHPVHLHGMPFEVFARDGYPLPQPFRCDTLAIGPFERWDAVVVPETAGTWAFHCHVLEHAEGRQGMFGMFTALVVE